MAVVINELEVVPAPAPPKKSEREGGPAGGQDKAKVMREIEKHLRREQERALRLWAH
jgi:hypothetical protein